MMAGKDDAVNRLTEGVDYLFKKIKLKKLLVLHHLLIIIKLKLKNNFLNQIKLL